MKKKTKKNIKFIVSVLVAILSVGTIGKVFDIKLPNIIKVKQNNGTVIGENNGIVKNYTMGGGTTNTKKNNYPDLPAKEYNPSYINKEGALIKGNDLLLEGIRVSYSYQMKMTEFETLFGDDKINIAFGDDPRNGYKLAVFNDEYGYDLFIDTIDCDSILIGDYDIIPEGTIIQISPYDFDSDGINELIVCMTDGIEGICAVFSYTHVDDIKKVNPFRQELCVWMQNEIFLDGNSLQIIMNESRIVDREYKYVDEQFMVVSQ